MKARRSVLLVVALIVIATSCGDGGPNLPTQSKGWLLQFKRVTLAADAPDRLEIEIVVRTGPHFAEPAPDGLKVSVESSAGTFEADGQRYETSTTGGRAVVRLIPPSGPSQIIVKATIEDVEAQLSIVVDEYGSMHLGTG